MNGVECCGFFLSAIWHCRVIITIQCRQTWQAAMKTVKENTRHALWPISLISTALRSLPCRQCDLYTRKSHLFREALLKIIRKIFSELFNFNIMVYSSLIIAADIFRGQKYRHGENDKNNCTKKMLKLCISDSSTNHYNIHFDWLTLKYSNSFEWVIHWS